LRRDLELTDPELAHRTLELQAERFLPTLSGTPSTLKKARRYVNDLLIGWPKKSPRLLSKIRKGDCEPRFPEAFSDRTAWSLFNAFTETLKGNLTEAETSLFMRPAITIDRVKRRACREIVLEIGSCVA